MSSLKNKMHCIFKFQDLTLGHRLSGPIYAAENLSKHLEGKTEARILDVAAGTGYVGELVCIFLYLLKPDKMLIREEPKKHLYIYHTSIVA